MFPPQSIELTTQGRPIRLHLFSTGCIAARWSTKWQPIWVLVIDHPDGIFIVDTGIRANIRHLWFKFKITRDEEIDCQLTRLNIKPEKINAILLTHHHFDHIGGLIHFPHTPVIKTSPLNNDITVLHTPGHTPDHCSVLIKTDTCHILFAGDICNTQQQFLQQRSPSRKNAATYAAIKAYAHEHPLIFLPTHDPASATRLANLTPLLPSTRP